MEALREAVYLRSYAQKSLLSIRSNDGYFRILDFLDTAHIASKVFRVRIKESTQQLKQQVRDRIDMKQHTSHEAKPFANKSISTKRVCYSGIRTSYCYSCKTRKEIGRMIMPMRFGKKYKYCHGR